MGSPLSLSPPLLVPLKVTWAQTATKEYFDTACTNSIAYGADEQPEPWVKTQRERDRERHWLMSIAEDEHGETHQSAGRLRLGLNKVKAKSVENLHPSPTQSSGVKKIQHGPVSSPRHAETGPEELNLPYHLDEAPGRQLWSGVPPQVSVPPSSTMLAAEAPVASHLAGPLPGGGETLSPAIPAPAPSAYEQRPVRPRVPKRSQPPAPPPPAGALEATPSNGPAHAEALGSGPLSLEEAAVPPLVPRPGNQEQQPGSSTQIVPSSGALPAPAEGKATLQSSDASAHPTQNAKPQTGHSPRTFAFEPWDTHDPSSPVSAGLSVAAPQGDKPKSASKPTSGTHVILKPKPSGRGAKKRSPDK